MSGVRPSRTPNYGRLTNKIKPNGWAVAQPAQAVSAVDVGAARSDLPHHSCLLPRTGRFAGLALVS